MRPECKFYAHEVLEPRLIRQINEFANQLARRRVPLMLSNLQNYCTTFCERTSNGIGDVNEKKDRTTKGNTALRRRRLYIHEYYFPPAGKRGNIAVSQRKISRKNLPPFPPFFPSRAAAACVNPAYVYAFFPGKLDVFMCCRYRIMSGLW